MSMLPLSKPFTLADMVGNGRKNREEDVTTVRSSLSALNYRTDDDKAESIFTRPLDSAIKDFQRDEGLKQDGWLRPDGPTERAMGIRLAQNFSNQPVFVEVRPLSKDAGKAKTIDSSIEDNDLIDTVKDDERYVPWPYVDSEQNVTIGIGKKISNEQEAKKLPIYHKENGRFAYATPEQIEEGIKTLNKIGNHENYIADFYKDKTNLRLSPADAVQVTREHLKSNKKSLQTKFPGFNDYPETVKKSLYDIDYNIGSHGFTKEKWPGLFKAVRNQDWGTAAKESHRKGISTERNQKIFDWFNNAAKK